MFQLVDDTLINGLCLSPNQLFWRFYWAFTFGLIAGTAGAVAVGLAVAAGAPAIVAGVVGWAVSSYMARRLSDLKNLYIDTATAVAK